MIRQSLVDERISDLHHHTLQSSKGSDGDMSKAASRRLPPPPASRLVIKKNASLIPTGTQPTANTTLTTSSPAPPIDPRSRIELLERNLRYVQQQHEITLVDLHNEISKLQQENRELHFRMANIRVPSGSDDKQRKTEVQPSINELANLTQNEPVLEKRLQEVQRVHFEQQINELRTQLIETEQKNEYLMRRIDEMNKTTLGQTPQRIASGVPVLLPDPNITSDNTIKSEQTQMSETDHQRLLELSYEKQRFYIREIARLRAVLRELIHAERLSSTSKILVRDCLASTSISESSTADPTEVSHANENHSRYINSSSTTDKSAGYRQSNGQRRSSEHRLVLPPITSDKAGGNGAVDNFLNSELQQATYKFGETPIARRGRRTQELQRTRLARNFYH
ncbi:unnamed protein product [Adineta ricciae]|uniref:CCDC92/74 N-terminal domain-containing protein n=1 Tax=Adineta ricciae TaxID=249248 RepID=A0A813STA4_ADIRI|nr:unnamed protein product [Adineta ricciae]CAF0826947.1 unnamed protein product [Adineta ricciae]